MNSLPDKTDLLDQKAPPAVPDNVLQALRLLPELCNAASEQAALELFWRAVRQVGADSGVFISAIKDDATRTSIRSLLACDSRWAIEYSRVDWHDHDPWLRHALDSQAPIRGEELPLRPEEQDFIGRSRTLGFTSTFIVPAPTCFGGARFGVLVLGSRKPERFDGSDYEMVRIVGRALAMELHDWLLRAVHDDLVERSRITAEELELLRHEAAGHTSKVVGATLGIKPRSVDYRFSRVSAKLDAPDRRTAMRIARLYGLI
ncbi:helix-turn-helix transcriptional regulator [Roseateles sp. DC23W]|uniref:Helix-turn-helix transcriptional regulator n=1 Tax=Pelomonas dachongensis TaxID=3299029 RepID=A0ABW7ENU2_9BURK